MNIKTLFIKLSALVLLSACNSSYTTEVISFHDMAASNGNKVMIVPGRDVRPDATFAHFANTLKARLNKEGFSSVNGGEADIVVTVNYKVQEKVERPTDFYWRDVIFISEPNLTHTTRLYDNFVYPTKHIRSLDIVMSNSNGRVLFEGRGISVGGFKNIDQILPYMLEAVLEDFPGESGTVKEITINEEDLNNYMSS